MNRDSRIMLVNIGQRFGNVKRLSEVWMRQFFNALAYFSKVKAQACFASH
jgi:hypothetical protein